MAGADDFRPRSKGRAEALSANIDDGRRRAGLAWPGHLSHAIERWRQRVSEWALAEVAPGRLLPWLPVAFGCGIALYFAAGREPAVWATAMLALAAIVIAGLARSRSLAFPIAIAFAAIATGFAMATLHTALIAHPVLQRAVSSASVAGFVEKREEREKSDRIIIRIERLEARGIKELPERIRLAVRKGSAPPVGTFVELKAYLSPPLKPLRPGGYDFARDMYFQKIGASGYALGKITSVKSDASTPLWLRYAAWLDSMRSAIDDHIRNELSGDHASIASALITGTRDSISTAVNEAMYISGLAHVLSISGYHMALVAGVVFFLLRASLALIPSLANRWPIKKWAAGFALAAAAFYLLLSGAEVATQRSFIMIAIVLIAIMINRSAVTFRTLAIAAMTVLILTPQAILHPSFQMSFAATLALVAGYRQGVLAQPPADSPWATRIALWGGREIIGLLIASVLAGLSTAPYAAYHFHRYGSYGLLANLLAAPIVSLLVMPMGILGVITMPFGFDGVFFQLMGYGIDWMITVSLWVAGLPGAAGRIHAFGLGPLLVVTAGLLVVCLLRTPLRWNGCVLACIAIFWALITPQPSVLVSADGQLAAIRASDGAFKILHRARDDFALKEWLSADADVRTIHDPSLRSGIHCDAIGCTGTLQNGSVVAMALTVEAFDEDCRRAAVVISPLAGPKDCNALLIDRQTLASRGAIALRWRGDRFEVTAVHARGYNRPWTRDE